MYKLSNFEFILSILEFIIVCLMIIFFSEYYVVQSLFVCSYIIALLEIFYLKSKKNHGGDN